MTALGNTDDFRPFLFVGAFVEIVTEGGDSFSGVVGKVIKKQRHQLMPLLSIKIEV